MHTVVNMTTKNLHALASHLLAVLPAAEQTTNNICLNISANLPMFISIQNELLMWLNEIIVDGDYFLSLPCLHVAQHQQTPTHGLRYLQNIFPVVYLKHQQYPTQKIIAFNKLFPVDIFNLLCNLRQSTGLIGTNGAKENALKS
jgi:hypothetical protein